ncbi:MAG: hypothetical protein IPM61_14715 [Chlorobi bacterium]|nr:hypothetical protein [Chlorobiota bacterium]MBX7216375.1 hypothetical protein [Candidatus Kapabacteria bacterium]
MACFRCWRRAYKKSNYEESLFQKQKIFCCLKKVLLCIKECILPTHFGGTVMLKAKSFVVAAIIALAVGIPNTVFAALKPLAPLMVLGPECPPSSKLKNGFMLFIDSNGDGNYDYVVNGTCDGRVRGAVWDGSVSAPPDREWGIPGSGPFRAEVTSSQCSNERYSWELSFINTITGESSCSISSDCSGVISSTCETPSMIDSQNNDGSILHYFFNSSTKAIGIVGNSSTAQPSSEKNSTIAPRVE